MTVISGRKLTVEFKYEDGDSEKSDKLQVTIPRLENEDEIKDFILNEINIKLN